MRKSRRFITRIKVTSNEPGNAVAFREPEGDSFPSDFYALIDFIYSSGIISVFFGTSYLC